MKRYIFWLFAMFMFSLQVNANPLLKLFQKKQSYATVNLANWSNPCNTAWTVGIVPKSGASVGKAFNFTATSAGANQWTWIPAGSSFTDGEVLARVYMTNPGAVSQNGLQVKFRRQVGGCAAGTYQVVVAGNGAGAFHLQISLYNGTPSVLANSAGTITFTTGNWYFIRARIQGTNISGRFWQSGTAEPGTWDVTATDSTFASGSIGVGVPSGGSGYSPEGLDYFSYATGTGTAAGPN